MHSIHSTDLPAQLSPRFNLFLSFCHQYYQNMEDPTDRKVVQPNPFDKAQPRRTRTSSGSVVRIFRGEFAGLLGGMIGSQGLDRRILVKEFTGELALQLAQAELDAVSTLQSQLVNKADEQDWFQAASSRSVMARKDHSNVAQLTQKLAQCPYLGILGEVNLAEMEGSMQPNEFYRALGVPPPKAEAVWIVYEYAGLSTIQSYCQPALIRRSQLPIQRGFFGNPVQPPQLPAWRDRANYVVKGIIKKSIEALATLHENGFVHRSIGRSSIVLSSKAQDKREAVSPFATQISNLVVKLTNFGFAGPYEGCAKDEDFRLRARTFGFRFERSDNNVATANFAIAEDMHALGFVVLGLLLTSLAELPTIDTPMPNTDEDSLQRLLGDIFDKDVKGQFREYVEAEDVWSNLVDYLDEKNGAGWTVLETLMLARETAAKNKDTMQLFTVRGLLNNPLFN
jgi:serine/threonine protein kinase